MYFWKCWRDNRFRFIGYLTTLTAMGISFTLINVKLNGVQGLWKGPAQLWSMTAAFVLGAYGSLIISIWALALGTASLGEEFQQGTADFLLTRPRRRRYWVWVGWMAGVCEIAVGALVAAGATLVTLAFLTGHIFTWRMLIAALPMTVGGAVVYGLAYLMTLVARSGRQGLSYSLGIMFIHLSLPVVANKYWHVHIPYVLEFVTNACKAIADVSGHFPLGVLVGWTLVAVAFPLATQVLLERAEA